MTALGDTDSETWEERGGMESGGRAGFGKLARVLRRTKPKRAFSVTKAVSIP